jgi:hypothetical protein
MEDGLLEDDVTCHVSEGLVTILPVLTNYGIVRYGILYVVVQ